MRIIAGKLKGNILHAPRDKSTRPLKDLARESIFNLLIHSNKISLELKQSNILDLYAGTGSFGLECLSRQARSVCFIEKKKEAIEILKKNIEKLKVKDSTKILVGKCAITHIQKALTEQEMHELNLKKSRMVFWKTGVTSLQLWVQKKHMQSFYMLKLFLKRHQHFDQQGCMPIKIIQL